MTATTTLHPFGARVRYDAASESIAVECGDPVIHQGIGDMLALCWDNIGWRFRSPAATAADTLDELVRLSGFEADPARLEDAP